MPLHRFWLMSSNIGRISAAQDMRLVRMKLALGNQDGFKSYREDLILELGNIQLVEEELDKEGLRSLAALA